MSPVHISQEEEHRLVRDFLGPARGYFVEVGANEPRQGSQTWALEQSGWTGILVEPQPELAQKLKSQRTAKVFAVACSSPKNAGRLLPLHVAGPMSSLDRAQMSPGALPEATISVPVRTLDEMLIEAQAPAPIDFLSVDIEGHELEALRGFDFRRWRPRLILLEDHVANRDKLRFMTTAGYRLIRYAVFNSWYVPADSAARAGWRDRFGIWRKYYLALPFRVLRNASRRLRQPFKDRRERKTCGH
ncbi:MAG: FkbM family methyltransferase [Pseudolabrys sp.]